ncbi:hypothetical protein BMG_2632 [Priestia megaterium]|nr:hypothetical protein BMG_2632 [Priestia megaterium]
MFQSGHPSFLFHHLYDALAIEIVHFLYKKTPRRTFLFSTKHF